MPAAAADSRGATMGPGDSVKETFGKYNAEKDEFTFETAKRPGADDAIKQRYKEDVEDLKYRECTFFPETKTLMAGKFEMEQAAEVRHTASSILKQDMLVKSKQEKEYNVLKEYESNLRDASDYYMWQYQTRVRDDVEERCRVEQRKIEMKMAAEIAKEAMELQHQRNRLNAEQLKLEAAGGAARKEKELAEMLAEKQQLYKDVYCMRGRAGNQMLAAEKKKKEHADALREEKQIRKERKEADDEHEMMLRKDLIRQIRAIVRVSTVTANPYDASEPPRHGVLEEMSLSELRERYKIVKAQIERETARKRDFILDEKAEVRKNRLAKAENLAKIQELAKGEAKIRHEKLKQQRIEEDEAHQRILDVAIVETADRIQKKKRAIYKEEQRIAAEIKEIEAKRQFMMAGQEMVEMKRNHEQVKGFEREIKARQLDKLETARVQRKMRAQEVKLIKEDRIRDLEGMEHIKRAVDERLEASKRDDAVLREEYRVERRDANAVTRKIEARLKETQKKYLPYAEKINRHHIETAAEAIEARDLKAKTDPQNQPPFGPSWGTKPRM